MKSDSSTMDSGQKRLHELGYKQELKRDLSYVNPLLPLSPLKLTELLFLAPDLIFCFFIALESERLGIFE